MITPSLLNENHKTNNLPYPTQLPDLAPIQLGTFIANARSMPEKSLLGKTENFSDPKSQSEVPAIILTHSYNFSQIK